MGNFLKPLGIVAQRGNVEKEVQPVTCIKHVMMPLGKFLSFLQRTMALSGVHVQFPGCDSRTTIVAGGFKGCYRAWLLQVNLPATLGDFFLSFLRFEATILMMKQSWLVNQPPLNVPHLPQK